MRQQATASTMNPSRHSREARESLAGIVSTTMNTPPRPEVGLITCQNLVPIRNGNETTSQGHGRGTRHFLKYPYISGKFPPAPPKTKSSPSLTVSYSSVCLAYKKQVVLLTKKLLSAPIYVPEAEAAGAMRIAAIAPLLLCFVVGKDIQPVFRNCRSVRQVV